MFRLFYFLLILDLPDVQYRGNCAIEIRRVARFLILISFYHLLIIIYSYVLLIILIVYSLLKGRPEPTNDKMP
jgi:uncharacterized membrane protein